MSTETIGPPGLDDYDPAKGPGGMPWTYRDSIEWSLMLIKREMSNIQHVLDILSGEIKESFPGDDSDKIPF